MIEQIMLFCLCGSVGSLFYTLSIPANDTLSEIIISTGLGTSLSVGMALIIYDFTHKETACAGISLLTGALGNSYTSKLGKKILAKYTKTGIDEGNT